MPFSATRRGRYFHAVDPTRPLAQNLAPQDIEHLESFDLLYRSLCTMLFNYVPTSGHPGGSISSGRFVAALMFDGMDYDPADPMREDADILSYAAGHKALGLYSLYALRNEVLRLGAPELLPDDPKRQLRLEDLLGFRRNPTARTPRFVELAVKPLDGHPTPATPFVKLATGASGVGLASSLGLAWGARDRYGADAPRVHIVEGEGGLTPGRVAEALSAAGTASLDNARLHIDWNQASIDSNHVCRDEDGLGDYVPWTPMELGLHHDWNVIEVDDGLDFAQIAAAHRLAASLDTTQPTAIVYRTVKGWRYGIEGRASHGAGHALCSDGFRQALEPLLEGKLANLPHCNGETTLRCSGPGGAAVMEECLWDALKLLRVEIERREPMVRSLAAKLRAARERLDGRARTPRAGAPRLAAVVELATRDLVTPPAELELAPGAVTTLRAELGRALQRYNQASGGALFVGAADLLGSTSVNTIAAGFPPGFWNAHTNPGARTYAAGGICEDAMAGICSGLAAYGHNIGVASSYAAFLAPLAHIAARLHAIGSQARHATWGTPAQPMILVCAHAGLKTGEDGPTHADPQALQLLLENFPPGTAITLTPWDPAEVAIVMAAALARRPAVIAPFVSRPNETVPDRAALGLAPASAARDGVYKLRAARGTPEAVVVLQESAVTLAFVHQVLPRLDRWGVNVEAYAVTSPELFDLLPAARRQEIFPEAKAQRAMGITGFTLPTMYRWIRSDAGRAATLHPYRHGHFPGSGQGPAVLAEAGLDADGQYEAIREFLDEKVRARVH